MSNAAFRARCRNCGYTTYSALSVLWRVHECAAVFTKSDRHPAFPATRRPLGTQSRSSRTRFITTPPSDDRWRKNGSNSPMFMFVYTGGESFSVGRNRWRPGPLPEWKDLGNTPKADEFLRRQTLSARDYAAFLERLKKDFPGEPFLILRYGDHQPEFVVRLLEPGAGETAIGRRMEAQRSSLFHHLLRHRHDQLYAAEECVAARRCSMRPTLPLTSQELAGLPLDRDFRRTKKNISSDAERRVPAHAAERRRGAALQPDADGRRPHQGAVEFHAGIPRRGRIPPLSDRYLLFHGIFAVCVRARIFDLGADQLRLVARVQAAGNCRGAVADAGGRADRAVAIQVRHHLADADVPRFADY